MKTDRKTRTPIKDQITDADLQRLKSKSIFKDNTLYIAQSDPSGDPETSQRKVNVGGKQMTLSHYVCWLTNGEVPDRVVHKDGDRNNCRPENLQPLFYDAGPDESSEARKKRRMAMAVHALATGEIDIESLSESTRAALLRQLTGGTERSES